ncbi:MAG: hypothetical protein ABXS91_08655 [Sulfurimonas sp.]
MSEDFGHAKSISRAVQHTNELGLDSNWRGAPLEVVNKVNASQKEIFNRYPKLKESVTYLGNLRGAKSHFNMMGYKVGKNAIPTDYVACHMSLVGGGDTVSATALIKFDKITNDRHDTSNGYYVKSDKSRVEVLLAHEMGHAIEYWISINNPTMTIDGADQSFIEITDRIYKEEKSNIGAKLSRYAKESRYEMVAEAFSEYYTSSKPRPLSVKIGKIIDMYYRGKQ